MILSPSHNLLLIWHWYFITMFLKMFNDPLNIQFVIILSRCIVNGWYIHFRLWWFWSRYCSIDPPTQYRSVDDASKETKTSVPTNPQLLEKNPENQWLFFGCNWVPKSIICPKGIKCLSSFINREYSAKPWNPCNYFEEFIVP